VEDAVTPGGGVDGPGGPDRPGAGPPVMWPGAGPGFEADPSSPAGTAEREWALTPGLARRRGGRIVVWTVLILVPTVALAYAVSLLIHH
jgi:hypothetical protein